MIHLPTIEDVQVLEARIKALEDLLTGAKRVVSPDGVPGLYFPFRVGILTEYFLHKPIGKGRALSVTTGIDEATVYIENEANGQDGGSVKQLHRVCLDVNSESDNPEGTNVGISVVATNAPHGNIGIITKAQYSPQSDEKVMPLIQGEYK